MNHRTPLVHHGYWCECWTQSPATGKAPALLASFDATSAAQAIRWIRVGLRTVASALDPEEFAGTWGWLTGGYVADIEALAHTEPCAVAISHGHTHVQWTTRPVLFLGLAHRQTDNLPACAGKFTPLTNTAPILNSARKAKVGGLLIVTNAPLSESVRRFNAETEDKDFPAEVITWIGAQDDDLLIRALGRVSRDV